MTYDDDLMVDGTAVAGDLREIFAIDVTVATGECTACGNVGRFAEAHAYTQAPGIVVRCPKCEGVLLRFVRSAQRSWLDVRGLAYLEFAAPRV